MSASFGSSQGTGGGGGGSLRDLEADGGGYLAGQSPTQLSVTDFGKQIVVSREEELKVHRRY